MDRYIHEQNLVHYRKVLSETTDPTKRQIVLKLLDDEQANPIPPTKKCALPSAIDLNQFAGCVRR
jgi:hypothetical protein